MRFVGSEDGMVHVPVQRIDLPNMPATVARLVEVTRRPSATAEDLSQVVGLDRSLAARVLRVANAAQYYRAARVDTIFDAVMVLGFEEVRDFALTGSMVEVLFPRKMFPGFNWRAMWDHSVMTAIASDVIYSVAQGSSLAYTSSVFVAGLIHDIGKLAIARALPHNFSLIVTACVEHELQMEQAEMSHLGVTHARVGGELAVRWGLPEPLVAAVSHHHTPTLAGKYEGLTRCVSAGNLLAKRLSRSYIFGSERSIGQAEVAETGQFPVKEMSRISEEVRTGYGRCREMVEWGAGMP